MAPVLKTYGKKRRTTILVSKEDTFDKLFSQPTSNLFESSSDREAALGSKSIDSPISPTVFKKADKVEDAINSGILKSSWLRVSDIGPVPDYSKTQKKPGSNRIRKKKKNESYNRSALNLIKNTLGSSNLASSTPKIVFEMNKSSLIKISHHNHVTKISPIVNNLTTEAAVHSSPIGFKSKHFTPKNILGVSSDIFDASSHQEIFLGFPGLISNDSMNASVENFYGFPSFIGDADQEKLINLKKNIEKNADKSQAFKDNLEVSDNIKDEPVSEIYRTECMTESKLEHVNKTNTEIIDSSVADNHLMLDKGTSLDLLVIDINRSKKNSSTDKSAKAKYSALTVSSSMKFDSLDVAKVKGSVISSGSLQNLNTSNLYDNDSGNIVMSSSFEHAKITKISENILVPCKINLQQIAVECSELNLDSSDIEESVINSADERSNSFKSGQLDEEESVIHTSDEECASGSAKDKDFQKQLSKIDSDITVNSFQFKELEISCNVQSEDVSAEEGDLYTESEIAKSSDSIEVSRTANLENVSSDLSTSSDKDILKDDESGNVSINEKLDIKQTTNYNITRSCSAKSKDSSFYSAENSASDDSERDCEYESDCELSCESNKSSRRSSLDLTKSLTREVLEQLRESVSSCRIQDEYEDTFCGKSRKSLTKRGTEWECPPSPRRSLFPLAPLFPLLENQEDPTDDSTQAEGSMCDSATASEEDSNQSGSLRSKDKLKEEFGRNEETGRSSGEDDSTKHSPVREASRLRRSRRLSRKSRESESKLNMVIEESDSESTEAEILQQVNHIVLPTGKKYRRSLTILKHLDEEDTCTSLATKGRHYDLSVESVINMQSKTGTDIRDGRKSLMNKRMSLLSQCQITPSSSPAPRRFRRSLLVNTTNSVPGLMKRLSVAGTILEETVKNQSAVPSVETLQESFEETSMLPLSRMLRDITIGEEDEEASDVSAIELDTSYKSDASKLDESIQETTVYEDIDPHLSECTSRTIVLRVCQQDEPISFSNILYGDWQEGCMKIGEGVFGEVFLVPRENAKNVIKIIPIEGDFLVNGEKQKKYYEICNELLIADSLSELREENENFMSSGFAELASSSVIKGRYPDRLIELWNEFDESKGSDNESPVIFGDEQLYLVLELGNAGKDLESYSFSTAKQGLSVFKQTVCALAVAEFNYEFEHRDLHWGNVLVSRTLERSIPFVLDKERHTILAHGVKATVIDFTLSRMKFPSCEFPVFCDIGQDPDMFIGTGDYQFDVYRRMRDDLQNNWHRFVPKTNVRWLHYLVDKMINGVKYQRKMAKVHQDSMKILKDIESWILSCDSSVEVAWKILQYKK